MFLFVCIYTWNPCFGWKRLSFEGFGFKNRGHLGSSYIYTYIYIWSKLLNNHHIPDEIQKCWYGLKWRRRATRSQFWNLLPCMEAPKVLVHHYLDRFLHSCPAKLYELPQEAAKKSREVGGDRCSRRKLWKSSPDPGSSPSRKERNLV